MSREEDRVIDLVATVKHIMYYKDINPTARLVLLHLVQKADWQTCEARTTYTKMASDLGVVERTVRRQIKVLRDLKLIYVQNTKSRGLNCVNIYKLLPPGYIPNLLESKSGQNVHTSGQNVCHETQNTPKSLESKSGQNVHTSGQNVYTSGQNVRHLPDKMSGHIHTNNHTYNHTHYINNPNANTHGVTETGQQGYNPKVRGKKLIEMDRAKAQKRQQQRQPQQQRQQQQQRQHQPETRVITLPRSGRQVTQTRQPNGGWI